MPDDKLSEFWERLPWTADGAIEWPADAKGRETLARGILGAKFVGALEHVLETALSTIDGTMPAPGAPDFQARSARAKVLSTLSSAQRDAVREVVTDLARSSAYWPLVKVSKDQSVLLEVRVSPLDAEGESAGNFSLQPGGELHWELLESLTRFSRTWPSP